MPPPATYGVIVLITTAAAVLRWGLEREFGNLPIFLTFYPAVIISALIGGVGPGLIATVVGTLISDILLAWLDPRIRMESA